MKTTIITGHEEEYSNKSRTLGVVVNLDDNGKRVDSLMYIFHEDKYIFFNTIMDMNDYLLYGAGSKIKTAYLEEEKYDEFYDNPIEGLFTDNLTWL